MEVLRSQWTRETDNNSLSRRRKHSCCIAVMDVRLLLIQFCICLGIVFVYFRMVLVKQGYSVTLVKHVVVIIVYEMLVRQSWSALLYTAGIRFSSLVSFCRVLCAVEYVTSVFCLLHVVCIQRGFAVDTMARLCEMFVYVSRLLW